MDIYEVASVASPLLVITICWKHKFTLLWLYAATGFICDILSYLMEPKQIPGYFFLITEFVLISFFFRKIIFKRTLPWLLITLTLAAWFIYQIISTPLNPFHAEFAWPFYLVFIIYSIIAFIKMLRQEKLNFQTENENVFLLSITATIYVYASGCFLLFLFRPYLSKEDPDFFVNTWRTLFWGLNIFRYLFIGFALYKKTVYEA